MTDHPVFFYAQVLKVLMALSLHIRRATIADLDSINQVIEAAVMTWNLPERVKRLSLPSYRYTELDFKHLDIIVAENEAQQIIAVATWEGVSPQELPDCQRPVLLHGIYVTPHCQHQGIGRQLFQQVEQEVLHQGYDALLVKAQADADDFFMAQGMQRLGIENDKRDYANRFWKYLTH
jgi:N-acetylglutamate synthase-like GNAT family acetyltransferase